MSRKSPVRHKVKTHTRQGKRIKSFERGKGKKPQRPRKVVGRSGWYTDRLGRRWRVDRWTHGPTGLVVETVKVHTPYSKDLISIDRGIIEPILLIWKKGWRTWESCSGHIGRTGAPNILFSGAGAQEDIQAFNEWFSDNEHKLSLENNWVLDRNWLSVSYEDELYKRPVTQEEYSSFIRDVDKIARAMPKSPSYEGYSEIVIKEWLRR